MLLPVTIVTPNGHEIRGYYNDTEENFQFIINGLEETYDSLGFACAEFDAWYERTNWTRATPAPMYRRK